MSKKPIILKAIKHSAADPFTFSWKLDESIFESSIFLATLNTGSVRSPIDANEFVTFDQYTAYGPYDPTSTYTLEIIPGTSALLTRPQLVHLSAGLFSYPFLDLTRYQDSVGVVGEAPYQHLSISTNGNFYIKPDIEGQRITLPTVQEAVSNAFSSNELIQFELDRSTFNGDLILKYSVIFCVRPTLRAALIFLRNSLKDLNLINPLVQHNPDFANPDAIELPHWTSIIEQLTQHYPNVAISNLHDEHATYKELMKELTQPSTSAQELLESYYLNIPIYFRIDPLAKVTSGGNGPGIACDLNG